MSIADKLTTIAENEQKVYYAAIERMWNGITDYGKKDYSRAFLNWGMSMDTIRPTKDIKVVGGAVSMLYGVKNIGTEPIDLKVVEERQGMKFDFSECTNPQYLFYKSEIDVVNVVDLSNANQNTEVLYFTFAECALRRIEKIIVSENTAKFALSFYKANNLTHCIFEGVLNKTGLAIHEYNKIDKESITSIINILSDDTEGLSVSINRNVIRKAFETSEGANDGINSEEWLALVASKPNWTIST